jgi:CRP-like cAMP-binding protein
LVRFGSGEVLFRADEPLSELHYLLSGQVGATRPRVADQEDVVDILLPVRPLCLPAVLLRLPTPIGALTLTGGHLITLPASLLWEMIAGDAELMRPVLDDALRDAQNLAQVHYSGKLRSILQRLGRYLLDLVEDPEAKPARFILPYDTELIAARFGCTKQRLGEAFIRLKRVGVRKWQRAVIVQDVAALKAFVHSSGQPTKRRPNTGRTRKLAVTTDGGKRVASPPVAQADSKASPKEKPICKVPGCEKTAHARGYCAAHYRLAQPMCKVPGCAKRSHALGYCPSHYMRWKLHGDPTKDA